MEKHYISQSAQESPDLLLNVRDRKTTGVGTKAFESMSPETQASIRNMTLEAMFGTQGIKVETTVAFGGEDEY